MLVSFWASRTTLLIYNFGTWVCGGFGGFCCVLMIPMSSRAAVFFRPSHPVNIPIKDRSVAVRLGHLEQLVLSLKFLARQLVERAVLLAVGANLESETAWDRL